MEDTLINIPPRGRKITPARAEYCRRAANTEIGEVTRGQLAVLAQGLTCTKLINGTESHLLVALINTAPAEAFNRSVCPIVFKSNKQLAFEIGRSVGRVSRLLSRLYDLGLITMQDSGNYKRYPIRNRGGEISDVCGIDLRILIARYRELNEMVRQYRDEKRSMDAAQRRYRGALRAARNALASTKQADSDARRFRVWVDRIGRSVAAAIGLNAGLLRRATRILERLLGRLMKLPVHIDRHMQPEDSTSRHAENGMHIQVTTPNPYQYSSKAREKAVPERPVQVDGQQTPGRLRVSLVDVLRAAPSIAEFGFIPSSWTELVGFLPALCRMAGISEDARRVAIDAMGENAAATAVVLTLEKARRHEVTSTEGYLRALAARSRTGDLHLARSIFGMAFRNMMLGP